MSRCYKVQVQDAGEPCRIDLRGEDEGEHVCTRQLGRHAGQPHRCRCGYEWQPEPPKAS